MNHLGQSKLVRLIRNLNKKEFKNLESWLTSPWSKSNKYYLPFYQILIATSPSFQSSTLLKETLYKSLYKKKGYNNKIFNNFLLEFTKEVENYLAHIRLLKSPQLKKKLLGEELLERKDSIFFEDTIKGLSREIDNKKIKSEADYLLLNRLNQKLYFQTSGHYRYQTTAPELEKADDNLDAFYLLEKYKYLYEIKSRATILKNDKAKDVTSFYPILAALQIKLQLAVVELYRFRLEHMQSITLENYNQFKQLFLTVFEELPVSFQQTFLVYSINDTITLNVTGSENTTGESFYWYNLGLEKKLLIENGKITRGTFNNIILLASQLGKQVFLKDFIKNYGPKLPITIRQEAQGWAEAQLAYVLGDYDKVTRKLNNWLPKNDLYAIQSKITLLKAYYKLVLAEENYMKSFQAHCIAFEQYIRRNKLYAKNKSISYLKFIQYTKKIALEQYNHFQTLKWSRLESAIQEEPLLIGKQWLLMEIKMLIKKDGNEKADGY